jgi:PAS domain S-box-containing protein
MKLAAAIGALRPRRWTRRTVPWIGALLIGAIAALAAFDIVRSYRVTIDDSGRELETQARIIAEQTARTLQAVDVVLRHIADEFKRSRLAKMSRAELHAYLQEQAIGLIQIDGIGLHDAQGNALALSWLTPDADGNAAALAGFRTLREDRSLEFVVGETVRRPSDGQWVMPVARRLESASGDFAGIVAARGRIDYFQDFYRDIALDLGTQVTLMHTNGSLAARHPPAEAALGQRFALFDAMLAKLAAGERAPLRTVSPVDGVEHFGAVRLVPDYPLAIIVTRDARAALAAWREQALGTALRTVALGAFAALLIALLMRQLARLHRARESLEAIKDRFALAVAGSDDGIWDWDQKSDIVFASARARELFGLPPGPELQPRAQWFDSLQIHPDDVRLRIEAMDAHMAGRTPLYEGEYRVRHPDGSYRWVRVRGLAVRDANGIPQRMAGSVSDIDARKRAEEALRQSEERYAIAMTGSNEAHWVWDLATDEVFASPMIYEVLGIPPDTPLATRRDFFQRVPVHPEDRARFAQAVEQHLAGRTPRIDIEYRVLGTDGAVRWMQTRAQCFRDEDGTPRRVGGATVEISQRKRAEEALRASEEALRASEERYQLAIAGVNQGVWDWDLATDTVFLSARAQELFGQAPGEPLRLRREWIGRWTYHPEDKEKVRRALSDYLRGKTSNFEVEYRMLHASGAWRWYHDRGVALRDAGGKPYRMAGSIEDITGRKNAEAERDRLEAQLRQSSKLEAMGTLAGGIAHDFNNILAAILGYGEMAQKDAPAGSSLRRHLDAAMAAALRAKSLVERILAFSRSGMGERVPVHVQSVVSEALDLLAASLPPGIELRRELACGDAAVLGDPTQVHQVVMNLCANAVQAMKTKGALSVTLDTLELATPRCMTGALAAGNYIRLSVRDTGTGIAAHVLERIFDPFFTTKEVGVGTGLGLSLVHGIVTDLGGGIDVETRLGEGSTFTVYLPWQSRAQAPGAVEEAVANGGGETILIVDDEEPLVRLSEEMLAELGYEPIGFSSSAAALAAFRAEPRRFDAVLSDEAMPGLTGSELASEIRKLSPAVPIVLMSGYVTPALAARAREAGVVDVLAKPLVSRDLARALALALRPG